ncbi:MAG: hypothetical protein AAFV53_06850 [Myxococcota bacterium]
MRCGLVVGKLVAHPCGRKARTVCGRCRTPICERHTADGRCLSCAGQWTRPEGVVEVSWQEMFDFTDAELSVFEKRTQSPDQALHRYDS